MYVSNLDQLFWGVSAMLEVGQGTPVSSLTARHGGELKVGGVKCAAFGNKRGSWAPFIARWVKI